MRLLVRCVLCTGSSSTVSKRRKKDVSSTVFPRAGSSSSLSRRARRVSSVRSLSGELASVLFHFTACLSRFLAELLIFFSVSVTSSGVPDF